MSSWRSGSARPRPAADGDEASAAGVGVRLEAAGVPPAPARLEASTPGEQSALPGLWAVHGAFQARGRRLADRAGRQDGAGGRPLAVRVVGALSDATMPAAASALFPARPTVPPAISPPAAFSGKLRRSQHSAAAPGRPQAVRLPVPSSLPRLEALPFGGYSAISATMRAGPSRSTGSLLGPRLDLPPRGTTSRDMCRDLCGRCGARLCVAPLVQPAHGQAS